MRLAIAFTLGLAACSAAEKPKLISASTHEQKTDAAQLQAGRCYVAYRGAVTDCHKVAEPYEDCINGAEVDLNACLDSL